MRRPFEPEPSRPYESPPGRLNGIFDSIAAERDGLFGSHTPPYFILGVTGIVAAFATLVVCALVVGYPLALATGLLVLSLTLFVLAGLARKALGRANHVLLEDVLLVMAGAGAAAWALGEPVWRSLDLLAPALGMFLIFGRLGCLVVGCCHGRPWPVGICYDGSSSVGRPLQGLRLFPIQLIEALWLNATTVLALALVGHAAGTAAWCWLLVYGAGRFMFEFVRGDRARPRLGPLFEAQWIAVGLLLARIAVEEAPRAGRVTHLAVVGGALLVAVLAWATRRSWLALAPPLLSVPEAAEWQRFLERMDEHASTSAGPPRVEVGPGSVSVALTLDRLVDARLHAYSFSAPGGGRLDERRALALAGMAAQRLPRHRVAVLGTGATGVFQFWAVVSDPPGPPGSTVQDPPEWLRDRALAFARGLRHAPVPAPAPPGPTATSDGAGPQPSA